MPYIKMIDRDRIDYIIDAAKLIGIQTPGELNYVITQMCIAYIREHDLNYQCINDIVGALEGAKLEFYRRVAGPYEDKKISENGDVYHG